MRIENKELRRMLAEMEVRNVEMVREVVEGKEMEERENEEVQGREN